MKKLTYILAAGLVFAPLQPAVYAETASNEQEEMADVETEFILSVDDVVKQGIEHSSMLLLLEYQLEILENQQRGMVEDIADMNRDLNEAERNRDDAELALPEIRERIESVNSEIDSIDEQIAALAAELAGSNKGEVEETLVFLEKQNEFLQKQFERFIKSGEVQALMQNKNAILQSIAALDAQIDALEDAIDQLQLALKKLRAGELQLTYETEEAELIVAMMLRSTYTGLLSSQGQIDLMEEAYEQAEKDHDLLKLKVELGLESTYELQKSERELASQEQELEKIKRDYERDLAKLALDIGIEYNEEIELKDLEIEFIEDSLTDEEIDQLVKDSYAYKKAEQNLEIAKMDLDNVERNSDANEYEINQAELAVTVEVEKIKQLKIDLKESIKTAYYELEKANESVEEKKRDLDYAKQDYEHLQKHYEVGLLSKMQFEQGEMLIKQAELEEKMAEIGYYIRSEQVKSIHEGLIQTQ